MRILHLYFQLHLPHQLNLSGKHKTDLFHDAESFSRANETEYQPFFALLERNSQKFQEFKISLGISGLWFEQAEKYDPELIQRLKKLINLGRVQIIALPYDFSLAWFYDQSEFESQVKMFNDKIRDYYGIDCSVFAMPELIYNDKVAKWAEKAGYNGMIIGEAESILDWRTTNRIYEAKGCKDLRLICQNSKFSHAILQAWNEIMTTDEKTGQEIFSLPKFQKELSLEFLRGDLVNLCLDTSIFRRLRERGIIKFFNGLIADWVANSQNRFYNALEVIGSSTPKHEISIKTTIMRQNSVAKVTNGIVLAKQFCYGLPEGINGLERVKNEEMLYNLREQVLKTKNDDLQRDFSRLTALDYAMKLDDSQENLIKLPTVTEFSEIITNFGQKVFNMMPRPAQIATKAGPGRAQNQPEPEESPETDDFSVKVNRIITKKSPEVNQPQDEEPELGVIVDVKKEPEGHAEKQEAPVSEPDEIITEEEIAEIDLSMLAEAEIINQEHSDTATQDSAKKTTPKHTKRRRVVIE